MPASRPSPAARLRRPASVPGSGRDGSCACPAPASLRLGLLLGSRCSRLRSSGFWAPASRATAAAAAASRAPRRTSCARRSGTSTGLESLGQRQVDHRQQRAEQHAGEQRRGQRLAEAPVVLAAARPGHDLRPNGKRADFPLDDPFELAALLLFPRLVRGRRRGSRASPPRASISSRSPGDARRARRAAPGRRSRGCARRAAVSATRAGSIRSPQNSEATPSSPSCSREPHAWSSKRCCFRCGARPSSSSSTTRRSAPRPSSFPRACSTWALQSPVLPETVMPCTVVTPRS